jgi:hypothetical protein
MGSGGARLVATSNPLQLKMEQLKREQEEKAKAAAKKASMASRLAAFQKSGGGGGGGSGAEKESNTSSLSVESGPESTTQAVGKGVDPATLDSRVVGMMKS